MKSVDSPIPRARPGRLLWLTLLIGLAYAALGAGALALAVPPGYASLLYPSAGLALAVTLTYGRAALPGVWLGAFVVNAGLGLMRGQSGMALAALPALIAIGSAVQAGLAAALLSRFVGPAVVLNAPRDIALAGFLGGPLACVVSTSVATLALLGAGAVPWSQAPANWLLWWSGDTLGTLIATPLVLTLIGRPDADWRPRRRTLGIPLLLALGLVSVGVVEMQRVDDLRKRALFERDAERLVTEAEDRLNGALHALQALHGAALHQPPGDDTTLRDASRWWLQQPLHLQAMGLSQRVAEAGVLPFEAQVRATAKPDFHVFDRDEGVDRRQRGELVVLWSIAPLQGNASALGVNVLSIPAAREAVLAAQLSGQATSTVAFKLTQSAIDEQGVVLYQALYTGEPATAAERVAQFSGVVFVTLRIDRAFAGLTRADQSHLHWCLSRPSDAGLQQRFAGPVGCEKASAPARDFQHQRTFRWGGHELKFSVHADPAAISTGTREAAWLLALSGTSAAALLGALLLTVTGHTRRTELAVRAGTEELRGEVLERAQAEAALRESGERLRSILDNVPLGVMFLDPQGYLIECNPRLGAMTHRQPAELLGRSVAELVHADDTALIRRLRRELVRGHTMSVVDAVRLRDGGAGMPGITARVSATAMRDGKGRTIRMVAVVEDITEHLRLEASERALHKAEAANHAKSEFLSRMSHELRTPLNAMIGFAQLLGLDREPALAVHQRDWTQQIQRAGWHLLDLINETLDLARIESGAVQLNLEPLQLQAMVAACRALVAGQAEQRQLRLREELDPAAAGVLADATRLKQVLTNLLSNAVKYNRAGGEVTLSSTLRADGRVDIAVTDTGLGMTPEQLTRLFEPYNRLGRERSDIEGTGIGLVITQRLTALMGGQLAVSSRIGVGSTFVLTLPAAAGAAAPPQLYTETSPAPYQQRLVHYVEDNETNIEVMRGVLAQRSQVVLKTSMLGLDGLAAIRREKPDLVLLDMHLPDISGLELLRHLKQDNEVADIPVIVVSADATAGQMEQALTLGALHYVTKPLDVSEFLALVDRSLEAADTRWGM